MISGIGIYGEMTPGIGSSARYRMREGRSYTVELKEERKRKMEKDYVTYLQHSGEPEQENCSTGIVPSECAESAEDSKGQEILVPVLISMSKYLFQHYRLTMYSYLNRSLKNGSLDSTVGFHVKNRIIDRHVCSFNNPTFWRVKRDTFIVNVGVTLCLDTADGNRPWEGFLNLWFQMGETVSCSVEYMGSIDEMEDENLPMLSSYLVPIFSNRQMDDEAEAIWGKYLPEALQHPEKRSALALAKKMGLSIEYHPIYRHKETSSILFFEQGELTVWDEHAEDAEKKEPVNVTIPANTIVINTNVIQERYSGFQIYHECIHFEEHYLFYRLQKMGNNDPQTIKTEKVRASKDQRINDPVYWMEKQANRGAYGLLMPVTYMRDWIRSEMDKATQCFHSGYRYQVVGEEIAEQLKLPWFRVRARLIQLGHIAARGALNCADHHRIEPFAFDFNAWQQDQQTFVIDKEGTWKLYEKNAEFREMIDSGQYTYADGHIVRNDPAFFKEGVHGPRLSAWANSHVDQCCVRFVRQYVQQNVGKYVFGRMNFDADYVKQTLFYVESIATDGVDELTATKKYKENFPDTFKEAFDQIRKQNKLSIERTAELMNLSDSTLKRWVKEPDDNITIDFVVTAALAMKLPDWISELLLDRAHKCLSTADRRHLALRWILRVQWNDGIAAANDFLTGKGLEPLHI